MNYDKHIKALNAINRALSEEFLAECRKDVEREEAEGNELAAQYYRDHVTRLEAELGLGGTSQAA